jgi:pilus assembly protein FimV
MNLRKIAIQLLIVLNFISVIPAANSQQGNVRGPKNSSPRYSEPQLQIQPGTKSDTYGPIVSSDTLWQISRNYRPNSSLSVYQVMQAIYEINPDAFEQQNINLLKDGSILKMPSEAYIFNVNNRQAQQKAQLDILSFKSNISNKLIEQTSNAAALEQTKELMEQKLEAIDEAQNRQFTAIRKQFSESINSVQSILDNNKKLSERLSKVNADIDEMRSEEQQKSLQMNQMGQSIEELLEKSRQDDAVKAAQMAEKNSSWLGNTITLILLFTLPVLFALIAFAYWMIKRKVPTVVKPEDDSSDDLSLDPFATEMDDLSGALSAEVSPQNDDKLDGGDLFGDDDLFDDVLSEELEELVEDALGDNIEDSLIDNSESVDELEDDDLDDLLEEKLEAGAEVLEQDDLDSLFDEDDDLLADVKDNDDNSELKKILLEEDEQQINADADDMKQDEGEPPLVPDDETFAESAVDEEEPAEISIDDLLNESEDEIIENPLLDDSDDINEEALQKLDKEITAQSEELDSVTDTLLDELVQMRSMLSDDDDEAQQLLGGAESQLDIQALDDLAAEIEEVLVDELDTEADISEVFNEAQQIEAEELAESEQVDEVEALAEPEPLVEAEELAESEQADEVEALAEPEPLVEAEELAELEKALEDFEKEESDVLTSNEPATSSSLNDLAFSADDFVTKDESNQSFSSSPPTLDDSESIDDFDDSELDNAFDDTIDGLSFESSQNSTDELDDLPGLGDWLVEDEVKSNQKQTDATEDDGIIEELEGSSFDEMLESIDLDNDLSLDEDDTGFDIAALLDETPKSEDLDVSKQDTEDFLDVEALLSESFDADDEMDKVLDLDIPLEPFVNEQDNLEMIDVDADDGLGAKLDLAHAYIEIGEDDSARELFDEILQKGTADQIAEVKTILNKLN